MINRYKNLTKVFLIFLPLFLVTSLVFAGCGSSPAPTPTTTPALSIKVNTIDEACAAVDAYLYDLAKTPEAKKLLAVYKDNMYSPNSCVVVTDYTGHWKSVYLEQEYAGWDVKQYVIQHVFDPDYEPYSDPTAVEALKQVLKVDWFLYSCAYDDGIERLTPVAWAVDTRTGIVKAINSNALRVEAELMK